MRSIEKEEKGFEGNERMFVANLTFEEGDIKTKEKAERLMNEIGKGKERNTNIERERESLRGREREREKRRDIYTDRQKHDREK